MPIFSARLKKNPAIAPLNCCWWHSS